MEGKKILNKAYWLERHQWSANIGQMFGGQMSAHPWQWLDEDRVLSSGEAGELLLWNLNLKVGSTFLTKIHMSSKMYLYLLKIDIFIWKMNILFVLKKVPFNFDDTDQLCPFEPLLCTSHFLQGARTVHFGVFMTSMG